MSLIFTGGLIEPTDLESLFFPVEESDEFIEIEPTWTMFDILVKVGIFESKGQAKKNWKGSADIPKGYSEFTLGKKKIKVYIWNPDKSKKEYSEQEPN